MTMPSTSLGFFNSRRGPGCALTTPNPPRARARRTNRRPMLVKEHRSRTLNFINGLLRSSGPMSVAGVLAFVLARVRFHESAFGDRDLADRILRKYDLAVVDFHADD